MSVSLLRILLFALPSFFRSTPPVAVSNGFEKQSPMDVKPRTFSTQYLDGVRGLASFIVFLFHFTHILFPSTNSGFIIGSNNMSIWQLPMMRFAYSGAAMVSVFFIISGYVLTHRYIQKIDRKEYLSLYMSLTSLTFRRALRLFLPSLASCILAYICASLGIVVPPKKIHQKVTSPNTVNSRDRFRRSRRSNVIQCAKFLAILHLKLPVNLQT